MRANSRPRSRSSPDGLDGFNKDAQVVLGYHEKARSLTKLGETKEAINTYLLTFAFENAMKKHFFICTSISGGQIKS